MNISRKEFAAYVKNFDFRGLFNYLGWNYSHTSIPPIKIKDKSYSFEIVADKSAFKIVVCTAQDDCLPPYAIRCEIAGRLKKLLHEHILIFQSKTAGMQAWFYSYDVGGKAKKTEIVYDIGQDPERLYERAAGLIFDLDEEDNITILDVTNRVNSNFATNAEKVTKKFYESFKKEHSNLLKFIKGIDSTLDKEWYASIMLNRLMFCYFMQKRGFLNRDTNYLRNKLNESKAKLGVNRFYSFYRDFLLTLFHKGFGSYSHSEEVRAMIGDIPYLNGGLFEVHEIEQKCPDIMIDDSAFESIFDLFDRYEWHLDSRECASGNEISPDVLGYIFEKYINDRAQMGAYYTQEDITEYISRNSIIPFIFTKAEEKYQAIFAPGREIRALIQNSGDKYIFDSVKKGIELLLPDYIEVGVDTNAPDLLERRARWNEPAPSDYALPTEIWREVVERRQRYQDTMEKIQDGTIATVQDFITYNLDICAFAQDAVDTIDDPQFIRVVYEIIKNMTILDPTCGSGAFLFAAMNILEPLYSSCLSRMEDFLRSGASLPKSARRLFEDELDFVSAHPNKQYYIYKTIILNNLYGVDIMKEATETAKLRLFLKLVSTANPNYGKENIGIEPLPDIDFNIKCGNSLVGYATRQEVNRALESNIFSMMMTGQVLESLRQLSVATHRYKQLQLRGGDDYADFKAAKSELKARQRSVNEILNKTLYEERHEGQDYSEWLESTQPFHWIAEFYDIVSDEDGNGGFDVVIGNPPYVEYSKAKSIYKVCNYRVLNCNNLYAFVYERSFQLIHDRAKLGLIIQHSAFCTPRMGDLISLVKEQSAYAYVSFYECRPGKLFDGIDVRVAIPLSEKGKSDFQYFGGHYFRFFTEERKYIFDNIHYINATSVVQPYSLLKICSQVEKSIATKLFASKKRLSDYVDSTNISNSVYYSYGYRYWAKALNFRSYFKGEHADTSTGEKILSLSETTDKDIIASLLMSSLFYWYYSIYSDGHNFTKTVIYDFPIEYKASSYISEIKELASMLMDDLQNNAKRKTAVYKTTGKIEYDEYYTRKSKWIIDKIDLAYGRHLGLTFEEIDFIINYDIKYRMGIDDSEEED